MSKAATLDTLLPGTKKKGEGSSAPRANIKSAAESSNSGDKHKALTVKVNGDLYRKIRLHAVDSDMSHQDIIVSALEKYLA